MQGNHRRSPKGLRVAVILTTAVTFLNVAIGSSDAHRLSEGKARAAAEHALPGYTDTIQQRAFDHQLTLDISQAFILPCGRQSAHRMTCRALIDTGEGGGGCSELNGDLYCEPPKRYFRYQGRITVSFRGRTFQKKVSPGPLTVQEFSDIPAAPGSDPISPVTPIDAATYGTRSHGAASGRGSARSRATKRPASKRACFGITGLRIFNISGRVNGKKLKCAKAQKVLARWLLGPSRFNWFCFEGITNYCERDTAHFNWRS